MDFSKFDNPLCKFLDKEVNFIFLDACIKAFECFKEWLILASIILSPDWFFPFEVMCDASGMTLGAN